MTDPIATEEADFIPVKSADRTLESSKPRVRRVRPWPSSRRACTFRRAACTASCARSNIAAGSRPTRAAPRTGWA